MEPITSYFDRLRVLIPARTLGLLLVGGTAVQTFTDPGHRSTGLTVMSFVILGTCLLFNLLGGMLLDKRPWHAALISSGALILFALSQRAYGPLGALGVQEAWVYGTLAFVAAAYPLIIATFYRGLEPAVEAAQSARDGLSAAA
jgi:hypothetical protein